MMAIYFALFGKGTKLVSHGKTSCKVELEFDDIHITRTKRPNRVVVNEVYEDDAAQAVINEKFGDAFNVTGYIAQNAINSFILKSPVEKLEFLEKFAFNGTNLGELKIRAKSLIKDRNLELMRSDTELSTLLSMEIERPSECVFPLNSRTSNREKAIKNERIRFQNSQIRIKKCEKKSKTLREEVLSLSVIESDLAVRRETIEEYNTQIEKVRKSLENLQDGYIGDKQLNDIEEKLAAIRSSRTAAQNLKEYRTAALQLESLKEEYILSTRSQIDELKSGLWSEYSKKEARKYVADCEEILSDFKKLEEATALLESLLDGSSIESLQNDLKNYDESITVYSQEKAVLKDSIRRLNLQQEIFKCPSCASGLRFIDDQLHMCDEDIEVEGDLEDCEKTLKKLNQTILKTEKKSRTLSALIERVTEVGKTVSQLTGSLEGSVLADVSEDKCIMEQYIRDNVEASRRIKSLSDKLERSIFPDTVVSLEKNVKLLEKKLASTGEHTLEHTLEQPDVEEELCSSLDIHKDRKIRIENLQSSLNTLTESSLSAQQEVKRKTESHKAKYGQLRNLADVKSKLKCVEIECENHKEQLELHRANLNRIREYEEYQESLKKFTDWETKCAELEKRVKRNRRKYASATTLLSKIVLAESIAMENVVNSINEHARIYLDDFFPDNPISVSLLPFKETKKARKPQITVSIEYKGMEADLTMLSGGELSRVILAYTLALGEIFNTPLLLLDECTASLDQELTGTVFDSIRSNFKGALVLIIGHQLVNGGFDKVVTL